MRGADRAGLAAGPARGCTFGVKPPAGLRCMKKLGLGMGLMTLCAALQAETVSSFQVQAEVAAGCAVLAAPGANAADVGLIGTLDFGSASALSTQSLETGLVSTIRLRCTSNTSLHVRIGGGLNERNGQRHLAGGSGEKIAYVLHQNASSGKPIAIDETYVLTVAPAGAGDDKDILLPIHGRVDLPGGLATGLYMDTLQVTLSW